MSNSSFGDLLPEYITNRAFDACSFTDEEKLSVRITLSRAAEKDRAAVIAVHAGALPQPRARALTEALERVLSLEKNYANVCVIASGSAPAQEKISDKPGRVLPRGVKSVIQVVSGKGGAGKTTVAVALAMALRRAGKKVALVDADIYGPSFPSLFGLSDKPAVDPGSELMLPLIYKDEEGEFPLMSLGFIAEKDGALAWRGPMVGKALTQLFFKVKWPDTDILVVDMPPGTGDAHLTLASKLDVSCAVAVTQPSVLSEADAARALAFCQKISVPVAGIIENMAFIEQFDTYIYPFGQGGGERLAEKTGAPCLVSLPLVTQHGDSPLASAHALSVLLADALPAILEKTGEST